MRQEKEKVKDEEAQAAQEAQEDEAQKKEIAGVLMDRDAIHSRVSVGIHTVAAVFAGWASLFMGRGLYALGLALAVLFAVGFATERIAGRRGVRWWIGNGAVIYLFFWLVSWTLFFNMSL